MNHPAMPKAKQLREANRGYFGPAHGEACADITLRSVVEWLKEHNMIGLGKQTNNLGLLITIEDWQSLLEAVKE